MTEKTVYTCDCCLNDIDSNITQVNAEARIGLTKLSLDFQGNHFCATCVKGVSDILKKAFTEVSEKLKG